VGTYSGKYDRRLTIQVPNRVHANNGESYIGSWSNVVVDLPCKKKVVGDSWNTGGGENFEINQRVANSQYQFQIRYAHSFTIDETMEIDFEGLRMEIVNVMDTGVDRRTEMTLTCVLKDNS
jgi:SPP1 family predicted phage head-tail adaptor